MTSSDRVLIIRLKRGLLIFFVMKYNRIRTLIFFLMIAASVLVLSGCSHQNNEEEENVVMMAGGLWKSTDGSITWQLKNKALGQVTVSNPEILDIEIDPTNSNVIYLGLRSGGIMKSEDAGENWRFLNFSLPKVYGVEVDPRNPQVIYASGVFQGRGKIYVSEDGGQNWLEIYTSSADGPLVISLALDRKDPDVLFASTSDNQVIASLDTGNSWTNILRASSPVIKITIDSHDNNLVYLLGQNSEVWRSVNGGENFENITGRTSFVASQGAFRTITTDPNNSGWVYLSGASGIIRSMDHGDIWEPVSTLQNSQTFPVSALDVSPRTSDEMIYGAVQAAYRTINGGFSWETKQFETGDYINIVKYDPENPQVIYLSFRKR